MNVFSTKCLNNKKNSFVVLIYKIKKLLNIFSLLFVTSRLMHDQDRLAFQQLSLSHQD
jgi:hypothetical protein